MFKIKKMFIEYFGLKRNPYKSNEVKLHDGGSLQLPTRIVADEVTNLAYRYQLYM